MNREKKPNNLAAPLKASWFPGATITKNHNREDNRYLFHSSGGQKSQN